MDSRLLVLNTERNATVETSASLPDLVQSSMNAICRVLVMPHSGFIFLLFWSPY
jgi:hypothetical protein